MFVCEHVQTNINANSVPKSMPIIRPTLICFSTKSKPMFMAKSISMPKSKAITMSVPKPKSTTANVQTNVKPKVDANLNVTANVNVNVKIFVYTLGVKEIEIISTDSAIRYLNILAESLRIFKICPTQKHCKNIVKTL